MAVYAVECGKKQPTVWAIQSYRWIALFCFFGDRLSVGKQTSNL